MEEKDFIKELFQEKLAQHQSPVSPELWTSVSSSITSGSTAISGGLSLIAKSIIGGLSAAAVIGGVWMFTQQKSKSHTSVSSQDNNKPSVQTKSENDKAIRASKSKHESHSFQCIFLTPDFPEEKQGFNFDLGSTHSGSASCGPGITLDNREAEVIPTLPMQTMLSHENTMASSENLVIHSPMATEMESTSIVEEDNILLPNIFTPNGDGKNDEFSIDLSAFEFLDYSLVVLDMNNQAVFQSTDPQESWNGKNKEGESCKTGTYIYYLTGKTISGKTISKYSTLRIQY